MRKGLLGFGRRTQIYADLTCLHLFTHLGVGQSKDLSARSREYMSAIQCISRSLHSASSESRRGPNLLVSESSSDALRQRPPTFENWARLGMQASTCVLRQHNGASSAPSTDSLPVMCEPRNQIQRFKTHLKAHQKHTKLSDFLDIALRAVHCKSFSGCPRVWPQSVAWCSTVLVPGQTCVGPMLGWMSFSSCWPIDMHCVTPCRYPASLFQVLYQASRNQELRQNWYHIYLL